MISVISATAKAWEPAGMHRRDADDQLVHEGGECGVDDKAQQRDQHRDRDIADAAETQCPAHICGHCAAVPVPVAIHPLEGVQRLISHRQKKLLVASQPQIPSEVDQKQSKIRRVLEG